MGYLDIASEADVKQLEYMYAHANTDAEQYYIGQVIKNIHNRSWRVRSMREALIKAVRNNDVDEIKDIGEYVDTHEAYKSPRIR